MCECPHVDVVGEHRISSTKPSLCADPTCELVIAANTEFIEVHGKLDNGDKRIHVFHYHPDCWAMLEYMTDDEGCFSYGQPTKVLPCPKTSSKVKRPATAKPVSSRS